MSNIKAFLAFIAGLLVPIVMADSPTLEVSDERKFVTGSGSVVQAVTISGTTLVGWVGLAPEANMGEVLVSCNEIEVRSPTRIRCKNTAIDNNYTCDSIEQVFDEDERDRLLSARCYLGKGAIQFRQLWKYE